jgi:hypothetical protein
MPGKTPSRFLMLVPFPIVLTLSCTLAMGQQPGRLKLGIKLHPAEEGVLIIEVFPGYAAEAAGLRAGDHIVRMADDDIVDIDDFRMAVGRVEEGSTVPFTVKRDGTEQVIQVKMIPPNPDAPGAKPPTMPELRTELLDMKEKDQAPRRQLSPDLSRDDVEKLGEQMRQVDQANRDRLKEMIRVHGFPTISMVGADGATAVFLIIQHADSDPQWQAEMLGIMEELSKKGQVSRGDVAYLTDRVLRAQDKPQRYGTQYFQEPGADGTPQYVPPVVEDPPNLDKRRLEMGLGPWDGYEAHMARTQNRQPFPAPRGP